MPMNTPYLSTPSGATTVLSDVSFASVDCDGLTSSSVVTLENTAAIISALTSGVDTDMTIGQLRLVFQASGVSLLYSSGDTLYQVNSSQSEAQPTS